MKVQIITIGDEILIGQIIDTNSAWMAQQLNLVGARITKIDSISDGKEEIQQTLDGALKTADTILITGGLGPTKDDVTKKAIADYFGSDMVFHQPTYDRILRLFKRWGRNPTPAHREQCFMPAMAKILYNKMGTAPGMWFEHEGKVVVSMPGVPFEMKYLMTHEVIPRLKEHFPMLPIAHRTILTVGEGESRLAARIEDIEENLPENIKLAFLPNLGHVRLRLTGIDEDEDRLNQILDQKAKEIEDRIPEFVYGRGTQKLEQVIGEMLKERGMTLATAESCTGGYVAHAITSISGSSSYFEGSVIAYSNQIKRNLLEVKAATLETYGAVSEQTVTEMVKGAAKLMGTDLAVATSGIAGPTGGTPQKPVGTIWIAVGNQNIVKTRLINSGKDRIKNIQYTTVHALNLIRQFLLEQDVLV